MTEKILVFFALAAVGYAARRFGVFGRAGVRDLIRFNIDFALPALVFTAVSARLTPEVAGWNRGIAGPLLGLPLAAAPPGGGGRLLGEHTAPPAGIPGPPPPGTYALLFGFANAAFLPIPLSYALHGEEGVLHVSLYTAGYYPLFWTLGIWTLRGTSELKYAFHPNLIALVLGAAVGLTGTHLPELPLEVLRSLGACAIPLALVYTGAVLAEQTLSAGGDLVPLAWIAAGKLAVLPALAFAAVRALNVPEPIASQTVLQAAMPCIAQAGLYTARFGGDVRLASRAAFLTTILCVVTVPFILGRL